MNPRVGWTADAGNGAPHVSDPNARLDRDYVSSKPMLEAKEKAGETLNENQKDKVAAKAEIEAEIASHQAEIARD